MNTVVWAVRGYVKKILKQYYRQLSPEQLSSIHVVAADDGSRWITDCVNEFTPSCERYVDSFLVIEWTMDALGEVRHELWRDGHDKAVQAAKSHPRGKGRPKGDEHDAKTVECCRQSIGRSKQEICFCNEKKLRISQRTSRPELP